MNAFAGQLSLSELDPALAAQETAWLAAAPGPVKCSECGHVLHSEESKAALAGPHCAAKVGRIVIAHRNAARAQAMAATRQARRSARRQRRARDTA
jgi:hypothetical protein